MEEIIEFFTIKKEKETKEHIVEIVEKMKKNHLKHAVFQVVENEEAYGVLFSKRNITEQEAYAWFQQNEETKTVLSFVSYFIKDEVIKKDVVDVLRKKKKRTFMKDRDCRIEVTQKEIVLRYPFGQEPISISTDQLLKIM